MPPPAAATASIARLMAGVSTVLPSPVAPYVRTLKMASAGCGSVEADWETWAWAREMWPTVAARAAGESLMRSRRSIRLQG